MTVATERVISGEKKSEQAKIPLRPEDFAAVYLASEICKQSERDLEEHLKDEAQRQQTTLEFRDVVKGEMAKSVSHWKPFTVHDFINLCFLLALTADIVLL